MKSIPRISTGQAQIDRAIEPIREAMNQIAQNPFFQGAMLDNITLDDAVLTRIPHGLGRTYRGYEVVRLRAESGTLTSGLIQEILEDGGVTCDRSKEVWLKATNYTNSIIISLRIF